MSAENDGAAALAHLQNRPANGIGADRVKAAEGLVEDQELWFRNDRGDELDLLAHALAEGFHFLVGPIRKAQAFEPGVDFGGDAAPTAKLTVEFEQRAHTHFPVDAALFREIADFGGASAHALLTEDADFARVRIEDVGD